MTDRSCYFVGVGKGGETRQAVVERATEISSRVGLSGLSIGALATSAGLSKSGVYAHFLSKEELQLAVLRHAREQFVDQVLRPALSAPRGEPRLRVFFDRWLVRSREAVPACTLYLSARVEFAAQPGRVRDQLAQDYRDLLDSISQMAHAAVVEVHFHAKVDPAGFAQALDSIVVGFVFAYRLLHDPELEPRARESFESLLAASRPDGPGRGRGAADPAE